MEDFGGFIIAIAILFGINFGIYFLKVGLRAAGRTAMGKGSFGDNVRLSVHGMQAFEIRTTTIAKDTEKIPFEVIKIEGRGLIPSTIERNIVFLTSVIDVTETTKKPVWSMVESFQEENTLAYQHRVNGGSLSPNEGFITWAQVGAIIPEMLVPPRGGERKLMVALRVVDPEIDSSIEDGFHNPDDKSVLVTQIAYVNYHFSQKGYEETVEQRDAANALTVKLAVALAFSDEEIDDTEGETISKWILRITSPLSPERAQRLRKICNDAFREAYMAAEAGSLALSDITSRLDEIADDGMKYQAIELCYDVMAADGVAKPEELDIVRKIANALRLDFDELQRIKDKRLVSISAVTSSTSGDNVDAVLGIEPNWSHERIQTHLRTEFKKWNGRLSTLTDGEERENVQRMLDLIANARRRYE